MARILLIPGLAVRSYAIPPAAALVRHGHDVSLLAAPAWRTAKSDLNDYGRLLAHQLDERDEQVDLLVGLSVGTQAAACAAAATDRIHRMLLISPTVDPVYRTARRLMARWAKGDSDGPDDEQHGLQLHLGDWAKAGPVRIAACFRSALRIALEDVLPATAAETTIVHSQHDVLSTEQWARSLAVDERHYRSVPHAPHSWPINDGEGFAELVAELVAGR